MKTIFRTLTAALLLACTAAVAQNSKPFTIPEVKTWKAGNGTLTLTPQSRIVCTAGDAAYKQVASQLADDYALISGTRLSVVTDGKGRDGDIVLRSGGNRKQAESYRMAVGRNVTITAPTATGRGVMISRTFISFTSWGSCPPGRKNIPLCRRFPQHRENRISFPLGRSRHLDPTAIGEIFIQGPLLVWCYARRR